MDKYTESLVELDRLKAENSNLKKENGDLCKSLEQIVEDTARKVLGMPAKKRYRD